MNSSSRSLVVLAVGVAIALLGFLLTLELWDLGVEINPQGLRVGVRNQEYVFLGRVLLYAGVGMSSLAALQWARFGSEPPTNQPTITQ